MHTPVTIAQQSARRQQLAAQTLFLLLCAILLLRPTGANSSLGHAFPEHSVIKDNITFWKNIYATYSVNSAVIHDSEDLTKVYDVVHLLDKDLPGAERLNRNLLKHAKKKYSDILKQLARGNKAANSVEQRVQAMFTDPNSRNRMARAAKNVRTQLGQKERFRDGVIRSGAYMRHIRHIFQSHGLPQELAYLPHVESSFNLKAYSKFGAAGIWQFTRATGKQYLRIDEAVDERQDPLIAADAAARYLKNGHTLLGDWPLAITAYNYGTAGMLRAKKKKGSYARIFAEYRDGHFKFASRNFYSEFLAALHVAQKLERDSSIRLDPPLQIHTYTLPGYLPITAAQQHFNVSTDTLRLLNPALKPAVFRGEKYLPKGLALHLPARKNISRLISSLPAASFRSAQKKSPFHRVQPGDTAGNIARRYQISLTDLIAANNLDNLATIYIGQKLRIPSSGGSANNLQANVLLKATAKKSFTAPPSSQEQSAPILASSTKRLPVERKAGQQTPQHMATPAVDTRIDRLGRRIGTVTVEPEESLGLYGDWLHIPEEQLRRLNNLQPFDTIHPGQSVRLDFSKISVNTFQQRRNEFIRETEKDFFAAYTVIELKKYTVNKGDTLWDICMNKFDIPLWLLKKYNTDLDFTRLHATQELAIPVPKAI